MSLNGFLHKTFLIFISSTFLFISCATTRTFETNNTLCEEKTNSFQVLRESEFIDAIYEPNTELILFDTFCMPFVIAGLTVRETGRVVVFTTANIPLGYINGMFETGSFMEGLWLPDIEQTKKELEELNNKFLESDFMKYKKYTRHWSKTTLNIRQITEKVNIENNESKVISETKFTLVYIDSIYDTVERISKNSSLIGETVGCGSAKVISFVPYSIGWLVGIASRN